jgi:hypothetical protein
MVSPFVTTMEQECIRREKYLLIWETFDYSTEPTSRD